MASRRPIVRPARRIITKPTVDIVSPSPVGMRINPDIINSMMYERVRDISPAEAWKLYAPPKTLGADEATQLAMDSHLQKCGYHGLISHAIGLGMGLEEVAPQFLGYAYLAGLAQNGLIRAGVTTVAEDMTKKWVEIKRGGQTVENDEEVKTLTTALEDFGIQSLFNEAAQKCDFDGGCLIYIDTGEDKDEVLEKELILNSATFTMGSIKRFTLVEAINLYPGLYNATDPLNPDYFMPTHWLVLGRKIHKSRFLYFAPNKVNMLLRPAYNFFGIPAAQIVLDYVAHFTKTREAAQRLLTKFSLTVFKTDMTAILTGGGSESLDARMQYLAQWRDNDMILAVDNEREDVVKLETPLAGVTDVVRQSLEFVAAMFRIPFTRYLGISPGGLNATGEGDMRNYYDHVESKANKILRKPLDKIIDLLQLNLFGKIDPAIKAEFCPLSDEDDSQRELTQKTKADRLVVLVQGGIIGEDEARQVLSDDPASDLSFIVPADVPEPPEGAGEFSEAVEGEEGRLAAEDSEKSIGLLERIAGIFKKKKDNINEDF